jgi:hypothetical protein
MSGLGYKNWAANDILAAADLNGYVADQVVMYFANAAARSAAITSPTAGMVSFRADDSVIEFYNGSTWVSLSSATTINASDVINTVTASTATAYTVAEADQGTVLRFTAAGTVTATVGTATDFTSGERVDILADGAAGVVITAGSGVTFAGAGTVAASYSLPQYEAATILSVGSNAYRIIGNITAV